MRILKWVVLALLIVIVVGALVVYVNLNGIVRRTIQSQSSQQLNLPTQLDAARLSLFGGSLGLDNFSVGSPQGFEAPKMLSLDNATVNVSFGQLRKEPIHVDRIVLMRPTVVVEAKGTNFNFKTAMDNMPQTPAPTSPGGERKEGEPIRLIIDQLQIQDATVVVRANLPELGLNKEYSMTLPSLAMANIGNAEGNQNGAAIKDVVMQVITALAAKASESGNLPAQLKEMLNANVQQMAQRLEKEVGKQIERVTGEISKKLPGDLGKVVGDQGKDISGQAGKVVQEQVEDIFGKKKDSKKKSSTRPPSTQPD